MKIEKFEVRRSSPDSYKILVEDEQWRWILQFVLERDKDKIEKLAYLNSSKKSYQHFLSLPIVKDVTLLNRFKVWVDLLFTLYPEGGQ